MTGRQNFSPLNPLTLRAFPVALDFLLRPKALIIYHLLVTTLEAENTVMGSRGTVLATLSLRNRTSI